MLGSIIRKLSYEVKNQSDSNITNKVNNTETDHALINSTLGELFSDKSIFSKLGALDLLFIKAKNKLEFAIIRTAVLIAIQKIQDEVEKIKPFEHTYIVNNTLDEDKKLVKAEHYAEVNKYVKELIGEKTLGSEETITPIKAALVKLITLVNNIKESLFTSSTIDGILYSDTIDKLRSNISKLQYHPEGIIYLETTTRYGNLMGRTGSNCVGEVKDGDFTGDVIYTSPRGRRISASCSKGMLIEGTLFFANNDMYNMFVGTFNKDRQPEQGVLYLFNDDKYIGDFKNEKPDGKGVYTYANHPQFLKYEGEFLNGLPNGQGKFNYLNGDIYKGNVKDGIPCDEKGKLTYYPSGDTYEGPFENGKPHGVGTLTKKFGSTIKAEYINGERENTTLDKKNSEDDLDIYEDSIEESETNQSNRSVTLRNVVKGKYTGQYTGTLDDNGNYDTGVFVSFDDIPTYEFNKGQIHPLVKPDDENK